MGNRMKRITKAVITALAAFAAHTSSATETIISNTASPTTTTTVTTPVTVNAPGGATNVHQDGYYGANFNSRAYALGLAASVSAQTCYGSILGGLAVWESTACVRHFQFRELVAVAPAQAAVEFLCQNTDQHRALMAGGYKCLTTPGPRGPVFQTGAEGDHGYGAYRPFQN